MDLEYWALCDVCDIETQVLVIDADDRPQFCSMCGEDLQYTPCDSDG